VNVNRIWQISYSVLGYASVIWDMRSLHLHFLVLMLEFTEISKIDILDLSMAFWFFNSNLSDFLHIFYECVEEILRI
jgi:hypothetical protein